MFKVFPSPGKGYGLQSTKNVNPGGMILNESPVAFVVTNKQREKRCASCLGPPPAAAEDGSQLRKCSRCKFVYYCGVTCQKKDWRLHKQECKRITNVHPKRPPDICLLASRYLSQLTQEKNDVSKANKLERIHYYRDLVMKNEIPIDDKRKEMLVTFTIVLQSFIDSNSLETLGILSQDLLGFLCWLTCNCFNIMDEEMASVGVAIYDNACFINHSCVSNSVAIFEGSKIQIRAIKPIATDEEISISYIEILETIDSKQKELRDRYFFQCSCIQCSIDKGTDSYQKGKCQNGSCGYTVLLTDEETCCSKCNFNKFPEGFRSMVKRQYEKLSLKLTTHDAEQSASSFDALLNTTEEAVKYVDSNAIEFIQCQDALFDGCIHMQKWELAVKYGLCVLEGYLVHYPEFHPITGIHLFKLGKIEVYLDHLREGLTHLQRAKKILLVTHGENHRTTHNLSELIAKVSEEIVQSENHGQLQLSLSDE